jgi:WD40 repeat protein
LRDEVLSLLKAQAKAAGFMERSVMNVAAHALGHDSKLTTIVSTLVGQELGNYRIEKLLGAGGLGEVYLARDPKLGRAVTLKVLPLHFVVDADRLSRILNKALEKDRELRYQTVSDCRADIRRLLRQIDSSPSGSGAGYDVSALAPDGTQILFRSNLVNSILDVNKQWSEQNLRLLPMASDNQRFVAWDWSPDGNRLIGNLSGPPSVVASYSFETNQYEKLTEFGSSAMWLPDSTRFVFVFNNKLYLGDVKTRRVRDIFSFGEDEIRSVDVSPDGKLVYYSAYTSESDIWLLDLE